MKFFLVNIAAKGNIKFPVTLCLLLLLCSCATYAPQYGPEARHFADTDTIENNKPEHRFYLVGDAGYANEPHSQELLSVISRKLKEEGENTTLLYLGDNVYPHGMPADTGTKERRDAEASLESQVKLAKLFPGNTFFIPGNHDWYNGYDGLKEQEKFITSRLGKNTFLPDKGCGITEVAINDKITLIAIDSQWYIEDWDNYPTINDDCDIKTREDLFTGFEDLLNDNQDKTIILAIHHPLMSNGTHGGEFSARKHIYPLSINIPMPIVGSLINVARKASGYSTQDIQSRVYSSLAKRIKTLIQDKSNVIVISGHDHNLQYIHHDNVHQVISGSGSKVEAARAVYPNDFSYGGTGYAVLDINNDATANIKFYGIKDGKGQKLFSRRLLVKPEPEIKDYPDTFPPETVASIYTVGMTEKSSTYKFLFGKHYRKYYSMPVTAKTVLLDTLYGGLTPVKAGGGHQTNSLRLADAEGREYAMRALRKDAVRFFQATLFKDRYMGDALQNTFAEDFILDFYTTAHPYTPFIVGHLAEEVGIYHSNPRLYYVPKQNALGEYNKDFGNGLYMIEEHASKEQRELKSFGNADDIDGTVDVFKNLRKNPKYSIDERAYIRARLFDMLIGDWDRHPDQWKWAEYKESGKVVYKPIPKDRDQAFTKYDGALLSLIMNIPALRHMQGFKEDIKNIKWFNREQYPLDLALIIRAEEEDWLQEAAYIRENLSDEAIDKAFERLPTEVQGETSDEIKGILKKRRAHLEKFALEYRDVLLRTVPVVGTDKKERFVITRLPGGKTRIEMYNIEDGRETLLLDKTYNRDKTKEIWVYGLDDDDIFEVKGKPERPILVRLLGGQNNDTYRIEHGRRVKVYDFKSKKNTYEPGGGANYILTDDYETNSYSFEKPAYNVLAAFPSLGYNPDDGVKAGAIMHFTVNNFNRKPYSQKHSIKGNYYFATDGFELTYAGKYMNAAGRWNLGLNILYTSPNFSISYFGMGNETPNFDDELGMDYNRVKLQTFRVAPSLFKETRNGSFMQAQAVFETIEVEESSNRFVNSPGAIQPYLFEHRQYGGINGTYHFENYDNASLPALGMSFYITTGWKTSLDNTSQNFPHAEGSVGLIHRITPDENFVFSTIVKGKAIFSNKFEFYQGATLGGDNDLRGYRRERFTGKRSFYQSTDLRLNLGRWKSSFVPMRYGIFGGYDYGRVWIAGDASEKWHQSAGGGIWLNGVDVITARLFYFYGSDGGRVAFGLQFGL